MLSATTMLSALTITIGLVGCSKSKDKSPGLLPARERYTGRIFRAALAYSKKTHGMTFILSAKYGLLRPDDEIPFYEQRLSGSKAERMAWAERVVTRLEETLNSYVSPWWLRHVVRYEFFCYAGRDYRQYLKPLVEATWPGATFHAPLAGVAGVQAQVAWFQSQSR